MVNKVGKHVCFTDSVFIKYTLCLEDYLTDPYFAHDVINPGFGFSRPS